jgi:hypothetical protein
MAIKIFMAEIAVLWAIVHVLQLANALDGSDQKRCPGSASINTRFDFTPKLNGVAPRHSMLRSRRRELGRQISQN